MNMQYSKKFYTDRRRMTLASSENVLQSLWKYFQPHSVIDVGCATGIWLAECKRRGVKNVCGIDGPWVPMSELEVTPHDFIECDLGQSLPQNIGSYDLALCIEVAEHLTPAAGDALIEFLTKTADVVLFSAAIPGQGGTGHLNEQLQSYWHERFHMQKFDCFDIIRPEIWNDTSVNVIYKQNLLVYIRQGTETNDRLKSDTLHFRQVSTPYELDRVHPELFILRGRQKNRKLWRRAMRRVTDSIKKIFQK